MRNFNLPDLGEGLAEAEVRTWHVKVGDSVKVDEPLVSVETAKAVVEVPSPYNGRIAKLFGNEGDMIQTGAPLVAFEDENTAEAPACGTVVGALPVGNQILQGSATGVTPTAASGSNIKAMPAARVLAKTLNVDLAKVTASGAQGMITAEDVKRAAQQQGALNTAENNSSVISGDFKPLRGVRRSIAHAMAESHRDVAAVTIVDDADIHAWKEGTDITWRFVRAMIHACKTEPNLNSWFDGKATTQQLHNSVNLGIAIDSPEGLFVPVLKNAEKISAKEMREKLNYFKDGVKNRTLPPEDFQGATITLSNFGTVAGRYANPVVVPPQVAILGSGKIREQAVAVNGKLEIHRIAPLSLTFDHRAATGGEAARFLAAVMADLQEKE